MVILVPVVLVLVILGLLGGTGSGFIVLLPMGVALGGAVFVVSMVLRDAQPPRNPAVRQLPTDHLRRQMFRALRPNPSKRPQGRDDKAE